MHNKFNFNLAKGIIIIESEVLTEFLFILILLILSCRFITDAVFDTLSYPMNLTNMTRVNIDQTEAEYWEAILESEFSGARKENRTALNTA